MALKQTLTTGVSVAALAGANDLTTYTCLLWYFPNTFVAGSRVVFKGTGGRLSLIVNDTSGNLKTDRARATTSATATASTPLVLSLPNCLAVTFDSVTPDGPRIYLGTLVKPLTEVSYSAGPTSGSGALTTDAGTVFIWNNRGAFDQGATGIYHIGSVFNSVLSLAEMRDWQWNPDHNIRRSGLFLHRFGSNGAGTVLDHYGNGYTCSLTGAIPTNDFLPRVSRHRAA